ncbi:MAG: hypothetical protein J7641_19915 [Cyanobacteria bacterium SID2]|nr:hypothetical protein [Cyanobacteria bacterium SID2]MBP0004200.1 hypothetical protein [Cyanobacteria bacterium SBC]
MAEVFQLDRTHSIARPWLGERAFYVNQLLRQNYPVLPGIVVSARVFREFWQNNTWPDPLLTEIFETTLHLQADDPHQLQSISRRIRRAVLEAELKSEWIEELAAAVASFSTSSVVFYPSLYVEGQSNALEYASLLDSYTSAKNPSDLAATLQRIWAELFRARSLACWHQLGISLDRLYLAVLVQPFESIVASGYLHARIDRDPHRLRENRGVGLPYCDIAATLGLVQSLVEGVVIPDTYRLDAETGTILDRNIGLKLCYYQRAPTLDRLEAVGISPEQQYEAVLDDDRLATLAAWSQKLIADLSCPFSLEWAFVRPQGATTAELVFAQIYPGREIWWGDRTIERWEDTESVSSSERPVISSPSPLLLRGIPASGGKVVAPLYLVPPSENRPMSLPTRSILVVSSLVLEDFTLLKQAVGLIVETGSASSHGAILARELGIPAVVGAAGAITTLNTGQTVYLNGDRGEVTLETDEPQTPKPSQAPLARAETSYDMRSTQLMVTLSQPSQADFASQLPVDGVGLIRSELIILDILDSRPPAQWVRDGQSSSAIERLAEALTDFARAFAPRPVYYRTFDRLPTGKPLGVRGTFAYQQDPAPFDLEVSAIARVRSAGYENLHAILPFVRSIDEFRFCCQRFERAGLMQQPSFQCWLMAEIPSVLFLLDEYVKAGVSGIVIGTNDLTQLLLGVDRDDRTFAEDFDLTHPAVLDAISQFAKTARRLKIPCSVCVDTVTVNPDLLDRFVHYGVTGIVVRPDTVYDSHQAIERAERRLIIDFAHRTRDDESSG